jgi:predicted protein tyrosine phosphatase
MTIIQSKRNQIANADNKFQGKDKRVLCLCSAGLLRSATIAEILVKTGKYNVRNAGCSQEYALIPLSTALLHWADAIIVVKEWEGFVRSALLDQELSTPVTSLDIPDVYARNNPELVSIIKEDLIKEGWEL